MTDTEVNFPQSTPTVQWDGPKNAPKYGNTPTETEYLNMIKDQEKDNTPTV